MACHVVIPYSWVECSRPDSCRSIMHSEESANAMNSYPEKWVESLYGFVIAGSGGGQDEAILRVNTAGEMHCMDGPAVENGDGDLFWFQNGKRVIQHGKNS